MEKRAEKKSEDEEKKVVTNGSALKAGVGVRFAHTWFIRYKGITYETTNIYAEIQVIDCTFRRLKYIIQSLSSSNASR